MVPDAWKGSARTGRGSSFCLERAGIANLEEFRFCFDSRKTRCRSVDSGGASQAGLASLYSRPRSRTALEWPSRTLILCSDVRSSDPPRTVLCGGVPQQCSRVEGFEEDVQAAAVRDIGVEGENLALAAEHFKQEAQVGRRSSDTSRWGASVGSLLLLAYTLGSRRGTTRRRPKRSPPPSPCE